MPVKKSVLTHLQSLGLNGESATGDVKKAYFAHTNLPLTKANLPDVMRALSGEEAEGLVVDDSAAPAPAAKQAKTPKAPKEPKAPAAPKAPKVAEAPDAALARLKADPKTSERWARVTEVTEMGKKGPTRVTILCDDKGPNGEDLHRNIAVQDLFQVKFSAGYKKPRSAKKAAPATEPAAS